MTSKESWKNGNGQKWWNTNEIGEIPHHSQSITEYVYKNNLNQRYVALGHVSIPTSIKHMSKLYVKIQNLSKSDCIKCRNGGIHLSTNRMARLTNREQE